MRVLVEALADVKESPAPALLTVQALNRQPPSNLSQARDQYWTLNLTLTTLALSRNCSYDFITKLLSLFISIFEFSLLPSLQFSQLTVFSPERPEAPVLTDFPRAAAHWVSSVHRLYQPSPALRQNMAFYYGLKYYGPPFFWRRGKERNGHPLWSFQDIWYKEKI